MTTLTNCGHLFNSLSHYVFFLTSNIAGVTTAMRRLKINEIICISVCVCVCACACVCGRVGVGEWE
jgi:hypothetical protein